MPKNIVIVGAGQAAAQCIVSLRHDGFDGRISLVGQERYLPYQRPPLSKKFLAGDMDRERLFLRPEHFYSDQQIDLHLGKRAYSIDRSRKRLHLESGESLDFDRLVLATGSRVRRLTVPGSDSPLIHYLRGIDDVEQIRPNFTKGKHLIVVGGGYIGLEVAAVAVSAGLTVTVIEMMDRVMARAVAPVVSDFYTRVHETAGVRIRLGTGVREFRSHKDQVEVVCSDDQIFLGDLVLAGVGILPVTDLAVESGVRCDNGISVDEYCRTSDDSIFAAGDCTNHPNPLIGGNLRLESVHNAQEQGKTAALTILGKMEAYAQIPWFWSDQYDLKLQITGLSGGHTAITVRGDPESRSFAVFYWQNDRLLAVHAINSPREFMLSKKLIAHRAKLDPTRVSDASIPFRELADKALASEAR
jgi:3-phenylpropionate/trans-cinnamate dioxygenase ferredoxin reductase subunit